MEWGDVVMFVPKRAKDPGDGEFLHPYVAAFPFDGRRVRQGERGTFPARIQRKMPWAKEVRQGRMKPVTLDGMPGFVTPLTAKSEDTGTDLVLRSWVLYEDPTGYYQIIAGCKAVEKSIWLPVFEAFVGSFKRKKRSR